MRNRLVGYLARHLVLPQDASGVLSRVCRYGVRPRGRLLAAIQAHTRACRSGLDLLPPGQQGRLQHWYATFIRCPRAPPFSLLMCSILGLDCQASSHG